MIYPGLHTSRGALDGFLTLFPLPLCVFRAVDDIHNHDVPRIAVCYQPKAV